MARRVLKFKTKTVAGTPRPVSMSPEEREKHIYESQTRYILHHPKYSLILSSLQEGLSITEIARFFAEKQWISVKEKTFAQYLYAFQRIYHHLVTGQGDEKTLDRVANMHRPRLPLLEEIDRLIRVQKVRLGVEVDTEIQMGKLFNTTHKEIIALRELFELKAKLEGYALEPGKSNTDTVGSNDVLRRVAEDDLARDRMTALAQQLAGAISEHQTAD